MNVEEMKSNLDELGLSVERFSCGAGIPVEEVQAVLSGSRSRYRAMVRHDLRLLITLKRHREQKQEAGSKKATAVQQT